MCHCSRNIDNTLRGHPLVLMIKIPSNIYSLLESIVEDQKMQIIELEDELQTSDDARLRLEVNIGALKQQIEKITLYSNEDVEERMRIINKRLKEYETELQEEQKSKQLITQQRKKI